MPIIVDVAGDWEADALVTLTTVKRFLAVENPTGDHSDPTAVDDTFLNIIIAGCSNAFEAPSPLGCGRVITQAAYTEYHDGDGNLFRVKNPPIAASPAPQLWEDAEYEWGDDTEYTLKESWQYNPNTGIVKMLYVDFTPGFQNIKFSYTGGFSSIPDVIQKAVAEWVCEVYKDSRGTRWGISSKAHAEYTIAFTVGEIPTKVKRVIEAYRLYT